MTSREEETQNATTKEGKGDEQIARAVDVDETTTAKLEGEHVSDPVSATKEPLAATTPNTATTAPLTDVSFESQLSPTTTAADRSAVRSSPASTTGATPTTTSTAGAPSGSSSGGTNPHQAQPPPPRSQDMWHYPPPTTAHSSPAAVGAHGYLPPYSAVLSSPPENSLLHHTFGYGAGAFSPNVGVRQHASPLALAQQATSPAFEFLQSLKRDTAASITPSQQSQSRPTTTTTMSASSPYAAVAPSSSIRRPYPYDFSTPTAPIPKKRSRKARREMPNLYKRDVIFATPHQELDLRRLPKHVTPSSQSLFMHASQEENGGGGGVGVSPTSNVASFPVRRSSSTTTTTAAAAESDRQLPCEETPGSVV